ncbi:MAG: biopolymer transporter ExbD [Acidobacteria bacterium]|nr:biopolymer transporter ExbD [Acidobacteriota bacterium]MBI3657511.1 biopolymer transporter ExbD [Acidobacteriota bacterium]
MGMAVGGAKGPKSDINITPYIDILLVLLIIFMVVTPTKKHDLDVRVPQPPPPNTEAAPNLDMIVVTVNADMSIQINTEPVDINVLQERLQKIYGARANKNLFIRGAGRLPYGQVVNIIDKAKGAGVGDIGLITVESKG